MITMTISWIVVSAVSLVMGLLFGYCLGHSAGVKETEKCFNDLSKRDGLGE